MQLTKLKYNRFNAMLAYCYNENRIAFDIADATNQLKSNICFYIKFLLDNDLLEKLDAPKELCTRNQKFSYRSKVKELPPEFEIAEIDRPNFKEAQATSPYGRIINFDNLPHNTAKGLVGKRSAWVGNSLETMSF